LDLANLPTQSAPQEEEGDMFGTRGDDVIHGTEDADTIYAGAGDDTVVPGAGSDLVDGGLGKDTVTFFDAPSGISADMLAGLITVQDDINTIIDVQNLTASVHADYIVTDDQDNKVRTLGHYDWIVASEGADRYDGGTGRDMVSYVFAEAAVAADLGAGVGLAGIAATHSFVSIERLTGSIHSDLFYGSDEEDDFRGLGGDDWMVGSGGGKDRYDGGTGRDTVAYSQSTSAVAASLTSGYGSKGDAARDLYTAVENLTGSSFDDFLGGDAGRNVLRGMAGNDHLIGAGGGDWLTGGKGDDHLVGGSGWDRAIYSGTKADYVITAIGDTHRVDRNGTDGTDTLKTIEVLEFSDGFVFL